MSITKTYKGYKFENFKRGFGTALEVTHLDGNVSNWCVETSSEYQSSVRSPLYPGDIELGGRSTMVAEAIINRIEAGDVRVDNRPTVFGKLNQISIE